MLNSNQVVDIYKNIGESLTNFNIFNIHINVTDGIDYFNLTYWVSNAGGVTAVDEVSDSFDSAEKPFSPDCCGSFNCSHGLGQFLFQLNK